MGNSIQNKCDKYHNTVYTKIENNQIVDIRKEYKIIDVVWLDPMLLDSKIWNDEYFEKSPKKKEIIKSMLSDYLNDEQTSIYK